MNFKNIFFRNEQQMSVSVVDCWEVRWQSRYGKWDHEVRDEVRIFISHSEAISFEEALRDAFKLVKHTSGNQVSIEKQKL